MIDTEIMRPFDMRSTMKSKWYLLCILISIMTCSQAQAGKLSPDSPELKQLVAMGYEVKTSDNSDSETALTNGDQTIYVSKDEKRTAINIYYSRKKLDQSQVFDLLSQVNVLNSETIYQVPITEQGIQFGLYIFGPYNNRALAAVVRNIELVKDEINKRPDLINLLAD